MSLIISALLLTYSGRMESSDTRAMLDAISSQVYFGDSLLDQTAFYNFPPPESNIGPLTRIEVEPLQLILATPLFWLADLVPGFGLAHTTWLFNLFITALAAGLLYAYALRLGYSAGVGVLAALAMVFCTILWPYSKTFFREPLVTLMILLVGYGLETARQYRRLRLFWLVVAAFATVGAWLTKEAIVFALPALMLIATPLPRSAGFERWLLIALLTPLGLLALLTALAPVVDMQALLNPLYQWWAAFTRRPLKEAQVILTALHSYLFSIGGSIWGSSPILLLALAGLVRLWQGGQRRYVFVGLLMTLGLAAGYALFRGSNWFGGLAWPPRFLIPIVPFLVLASLPAWQYLLERRSRWAWALTTVLIVYSLWIQITAVSLPWERYTAALPAEANALGEWGGGLNSLPYLRWVVIPSLWSSQQWDFAWVRVSGSLWPWLALAVAWLGGWRLWRCVRAPDRLRWLDYGLPVATLLAIGVGLRAIYYDPAYLGDRPNLHAFLPELQAATQPGDMVMLDNERYAPFFLNYGKLTHPRIVTLSDQPGESPSPEQPARIQSPSPERLLAQITAPTIHKLAVGRKRLWLLADSSSWLPWRVRPVERFMTRTYYPVGERSTTTPDPEIRLIEYSTVLAPDPMAFQSADYLAGTRFGDSINLVGFSLPVGERYRPGAVLPISFYWATDSALDRDYTMAWFLVDEARSRVIQSVDTPPVWGLAPTSQWQPGAPVIENRALTLPPDLDAGRYQIWLRVYESGAPEQVLPIQAGEQVDTVTALLPISIYIELPPQP